MGRPFDKTTAKLFIGAINFYKFLWPQRAHILAPLADIIDNNKFSWDNDKQQVFDETKAVLGSNYINKYPNYTKPFHIYTDSSTYQLGAVIIQEANQLNITAKS